MTEKRKPLRPQQEAFAKEYVKALASGGTQLEAFRKAYPNQKGSDKVCAVTASRLADKPHVRERIKELQQAMDREFAIENKDLLEEGTRLAFADLRKLFHNDGRLKAPHELDDDTAKAIASFKRTDKKVGDVTYTTYEYKFWDKNSALERLYKHKGLFEVDNKQKGPSTLEALYERIVGTKPKVVDRDGG